MSQIGRETPPEGNPRDPHLIDSYTSSDDDDLSSISSTSSTKGSKKSRSKRARSQKSHNSSISGLTTLDNNSDFGLQRFLHPLGAGARMGLADTDRYTQEQKKRVRKAIRENLDLGTVRQALMEERQILAEKLSQPAYVVEPSKLWEGLELARPAKDRIYKQCKKELLDNERNRFADESSTENLAEFFNYFVELVNESHLNEDQAIRLFKLYFRGNMGQSVQVMIAKLGLRETISNYRAYKCNNVTFAEYENELARWKLGDKVSTDIFDLYSKILAAYPKSSIEVVLEMTKLKAKQYLSTVALKELNRAETVKLAHTGCPLSLHDFVQQVEMLTDNSNKSDNSKVKDNYTVPVNTMSTSVSDSEVEQLKQEVKLLRTEVEEMKQAQEETEAELFFMHNHLAETKAMNQCHEMPKQTALPREQTQAKEPWKAREYLYPGGEHYANAARQLKVNWPKNDLIMVSMIDQTYDVASDGTYRPKYGAKLPRFPEQKAVFVYDKRDGKYYLTKTVRDFFRSKCFKCAMSDHRSYSTVCPLNDTEPTWYLCKTCGTGFHTECRLHPEANPKNGYRE